MVEVISVVIFRWIVMAATTTMLTEILKEVLPWLHYQRAFVVAGKERIFYVEKTVALVIAAVLSWAVMLDFFELFGIDSRIAYLGWVVSFLVVSKGSNGVHMLWGQIKTAYTKFMDEFGPKE